MYSCIGSNVLGFSVGVFPEIINGVNTEREERNSVGLKSGGTHVAALGNSDAER